jgi:hypothetical protein
VKHLNRKLSDLKPVFLISCALLLTACGDSNDSPNIAPVNIDPPLLDVDESGSSKVNDNLNDLKDTLPDEQLSDAEKDALSFMREEEKLARDVYLFLYDIWGTKIFSNIASSEQTHTDAVLRLIQKYGLTDPADGKAPGEFSDPTLQGIHDMLIAQGSASQIDALIVGATIEDLDIADILRLMADIDNQDINIVFENLRKGSRNHLRAFTNRLADQNIVYAPVYISQEDYDTITNSPMETGK